MTVTTIAIALHLATALIAFPLGIVMLIRAKGTPSHTCGPWSRSAWS